ncbi:type II secretion system F family protein [Luxibacter massiliensis]|uniref:type II secretion system F family protein n=1 Tax=Luxibacter massiliensis TaxID=2219695 RepID=UPI000F058A7D|nr:type II secretion system F family protein [Luxibacter massiliensis]
MIFGGYLFYGTWTAGILLMPLTGFYLYIWQQEQCRRKEQEFRGQFKESIRALAAALNVGYSVENALREAAVEMRALYKKDSRIRREYDRMIYQMDMNRTAEQVMGDFAERVEQEDVIGFTAVFTAAKRTGGDSIQIIRNAVKDISEKMEVENEIDTLLSAKKLEFRIMCVIPMGIILYMKLAFPEFMQVLYGNLFGGAVMSMCLGIYLAAWRIGKAIVEIEV